VGSSILSLPLIFFFHLNLPIALYSRRNAMAFDVSSLPSTAPPRRTSALSAHHTLYPPWTFSSEVEPRRRRRWLAGSDAEPPELRRAAAERAQKLRVGGGGADADEKKLS
jgi:hypothetical protein